MSQNHAELDSKQHELDALQQRARQLEQEITDTKAAAGWRASEFYTAYYATTGFMLGLFGAMTSLLVNVVGAPIAGRNPLELIRVYLTFPLGEKALQLTDQAQKIYAIDDGMIVAIGCCLYLVTGMLLGVPFFVVLARFTAKSSVVVRLLVAGAIAIGMWLVNFYGILSWLQPLLFGGNWITDPQYLPPWVAAGTHLVFGWTLAVLYPLGRYVPYQRPTEQA